MVKQTEWVLVWEDNFDGEAGTAPDPEKWRCIVGGQGWGNAERQYYTERLENAALDGHGNLVITARKENPEDYHCWYGAGTHTSARLTTKGQFEFTYGRVEAQIKIPYGKGLWPAFWMLGTDFEQVGWPKCGEIDIMEVVGKEPKTVYGTVHGPGYHGAKGMGNKLALVNDVASEYHVFAVEWEESAIRWYVDGELYHAVTPEDLDGKAWVFDHDFFILLNVAVGGHWPGDPDDTTVFPQTMQIAWVRIYQDKALLEKP